MPRDQETSHQPRPSGPGRHAPVTGIDYDWVLDTPLVRMSRWHCLERDAGITRERHQHWRVIGFVHEGAFQLRTPRGGGLMDSLQVGFFNALEPYTTSHPCGPGDHGTGLILRADLFDEILARHHPRAAEDSRRLPVRGPCPTETLDRHLELLRAAESADGVDPLAAEEAAVAIVDRLLRAAAADPADDGAEIVSPRQRDLAESTRNLLARGFRQPLHLDAVATSVGSTPAHLCRVFRKATGSTIHAYLTRLRLRAALEPLLDGTEDLSGLAFDLGFSSHSHFTFAFRREFGRTPSRWRDAAPRRSGPRRPGRRNPGRH